MRYTDKEIEKVSNLIKNSSLLSGYTNKYLGGEEIQKFENEFARYHDCKFGITVNSGTSALFVSQKAAGINKTEVAVPAITFTATTSQVLACNSKPKFMDINKETYCMNCDFDYSKIKYAIPVHLLGHPLGFQEIKKMKDEGVFVIEDCAQATGAKDGNKMVGSMGDCGIFSFQETKHITTLGEGGIIITNNEEFAEKCRRIRNHGEYYKDSMEIGYNFRMTEIQAGFGRLQLKRLPQIIKKFKENANYIYKNLPNFIEPPKIKKNVEHSFFILGCKYQQKMLTKTREEYLKKLSEKREKEFEKEEDSDIKGINSKPGKIIGSGYKSVQYEIPLYKKYKPKIKLQNAENFVKQSIFLDIHRWRSRNEINKELELMQNVQKEMSN